MKPHEEVIADAFRDYVEAMRTGEPLADVIDRNRYRRALRDHGALVTEWVGDLDDETET